MMMMTTKMMNQHLRKRRKNFNFYLWTWKSSNDCNLQEIVLEIIRTRTCADQRTINAWVTQKRTACSARSTSSGSRSTNARMIYARVTPESLTCSRVTHESLIHAEEDESLTSHSPMRKREEKGMSHSRVTHPCGRGGWVTHQLHTNHSPAHELRTHTRMRRCATQRNAAQRTSYSRVTHLLTSYARTHACADVQRSATQRNARVTPESLTCSRVTHARMRRCATQRNATHESLPSHSPAHELRTHARTRRCAKHEPRTHSESWNAWNCWCSYW